MEVFRFMVPSEWEQINKEGVLKPKHRNGELQPIYCLPEDPFVWGYRETFEMLRWIETVSGELVDRLIKFDTPILKPGFKGFVQEGNAEPWSKMGTRKHVSFYRRGDYECPEIIVFENIPLEAISLVDLP